MPGTSFDRVADVYDATRGGERRGDSFAADLTGWITGDQVLEVGVGTGVVASGLRSSGHDVVGCDLSVRMLRHAISRVGATVARADADRLPFADHSIDTVVFVWVLHLVGDARHALVEACRVLRPGGRVVTVTNDGDFDDGDELAGAYAGLDRLLRPGRTSRDVISSAPDQLTLEHRGHTRWDEFDTTVHEQIEGVEQRQYSSLWDVDDATWADVVEPVLERLRALPDHDRPRRRRSRHPIVVWTRRDP